MANKMLIDATHPEETRVVVLRGSRIEEFDFESASKRQLRGNIYLAKVIRVEPSLQAAFVDYGGNRHGFLAFTEIHPDYYQIPVSDRQALLEYEASEEHEEEVERRPRQSRRRRGDRTASAEHRHNEDVIRGPAESDEDGTPHADQPHADQPHAEPHMTEAPVAADAGAHDHGNDAADAPRPVHLDASQTPPYDDPTPNLIQRASEVHDRDPSVTDEQTNPGQGPAASAQVHASASDIAPPPAADTDATVGTGSPIHADDEGHGPESDSGDGVDQHGEAHHSEGDLDEGDEEEQVDHIGGDAMEEIPRPTYRPRRQYKIQEVIKRRQVLLVQVVKEERGNKGAALTTYLSLAGRYSVLMPNTARGGGISRKITDAGDRQRLKTIAQDLEVPDGMGVILRTAGASRTKPEVKRDFEYLMRMWETVRETTLASTAPKLVYEEGSLIKRAIRDLYNKDVEEIVVAGEEGYRDAKEFMRLLMPSHAKSVQPWRDPAPLFTKAGAEAQLDAMFSSHVSLKSGGYLVINQTEALVAIDVNSGRSTREHNIEDTAVRTNCEAADEVARQLRLRDLAGLIVVDFIDMEEGRNNRTVERRMKDALKDDRARIQIGRISHFGLLEMSRQRIRTGVLEGSTEVCQHCAGAGTVRSTASIALHVLRTLEDALISDASRNITVRTRSSVVLYILNNKRVHLTELEGRFGVAVCFENDEHLTATVYCALERGEAATGPVQPIRPVLIPEDEPEVEAVEPETDEEEQTEGQHAEGEMAADETGDTRRRRRRRRGRGRDRESSGIAEDAPQPADDALGFIQAVEGTPAESAGDEGVADSGDSEPDEALVPRDGRSRRRRSRRGGRRGERSLASSDEDGSTAADAQGDAAHHDPAQHEPAHGEVASLNGGTPRDGAAEGAAIDNPAIPPAHIAEGESHVADGRPAEPAAAPPAIEAVDPTPAPVHVQPTAVAPDDVPAVPAEADSAEDLEEPDARPSRRPEPVSSELDPSRPKRSGWWQRAKATLGG